MNRGSTICVLVALFLLLASSQARAVVDIIMYQCEEEALLARIDKTQTYVDYFLVVETQKEHQSGFCFNRLKFINYNRKVIFLPVRNIPGKFTSYNDQGSMDFLNNSIKEFLNILIMTHDIVLLSQLDTIASKSDVDNFRNERQEERCFEAQDKTSVLLMKGKKFISEINAKTLKIAGRQKCRQPKYFETNYISPVPINSKIYQPVNGTQARLIFDCFPYNGQSHILDLRLRITNSFVDFYIISEGAWSDTGLQKPLRFNFSSMENYEVYANKIVYIPMRTMINMVEDQSWEMKWGNERMMKNIAKIALDSMARDRDVIVISDLDEILSSEGIYQFNPDKYEWMGTQLRTAQFYFNRVTIFKTKQRENLPNYLIKGTKITTYGVLRDKFGNLTNVRYGQGCPEVSQDYASHEGNYYIKCKPNVIYLSGWHFTSVLSNQALDQKFRMSADWTVDDQEYDFGTIRTGTIVQSTYQDVDIFDWPFPNELVTDIMTKGKKSIFAPYFVSLDPQKYKLKDDDSEIYINQYLNYDPPL